MLGIPKKLSHIWIGDKPAPKQWINTWIDKHPDWEYTLYDNEFLNSYNFRTRELINEYMRLKMYAGVADLMRLEILYEYGGLMPGADSICYHNTGELFSKKCAYMMFENEFIRGKLLSPVYACDPKNEFVGILIEEILKRKPTDLIEPWISTGNLFVTKMVELYNPDVIIFPSHYFNPVHYTGIVYKGNDKIYAKQLFGSTLNLYDEDDKKIDTLTFFKRKIAKRKRRKIEKENTLIMNQFNQRLVETRKNYFDIDFSKNHIN